jgi:VWFA-related protein
MGRRHRASRFPAAAVILCAVLSLAAGQEKPPVAAVVQESARVTLIEIPVNVIGKDGKPVTGLTAADFELFDDGKKQPISGIDVIDLARAPVATPDAAEKVPASARRLWLLVFDLTYTSPSALVRARDGALRFVTTTMRPNDLAAVGTLSIDSGWKLLVNFTRDRHQLGGAIDTLGLVGTVGRAADPLAFAFQPPGPAGGTAIPGPGGKYGDLMLSNLKDMQRLQKQASDSLARGRVAKLLGSLSGIARVLDSARGRKHVLFFSEGFESRLLSGHMAGGDKNSALSQNINTAATDTSTPQGAGDAAAYGEVWKIDSDTRYGNSGTRNAMGGALEQFNRSDVVLDAIDTSGLRAEGDVSDSGNPGSGTDALYAMATATNGDLVRNSNQLEAELGKLEERTSLVYLLLYQPGALSKPGAFHALKVKVKTPGARVLARSGYYEPRPYQALSPLERVLAAGDLITGGTRTNEVQASLLAAPFASQTDLAQVPVLIEIPGKPLLAGDSSGQASVQIYVYANDGSGMLADYMASEMTLDLSKVGSTLEAGGLKFYGTLYLPVGQFVVQALVRNGTTGRAGVFSTRFEVPEIPGGAPTVLPPFFEEEPGRWLMVRGNPRVDAPPRPVDYPFAVAGESFIPAAAPVLSQGAAARVAVVIYNFGASAKPEPLEVRAEIVGADGKSRPADVTVIRRSDIERGGGRKIVLDFKPQGLSAGRYALKVAVTDPASKKTAQASSLFEVP